MADSTINYDRPTLSELLTRTRGDMAGKVTGSLAYLRGSLEWALAGVLSGAVNLTYGAIDQLYKNILMDRATGTWLERLASKYNITRRHAFHGGGLVTFTWTAAGSNIPADTVITDAAGNQYVTVGITADPGGPLYPDDGYAVVFSSYEGAAANVEAGTILTITTPIAGITSAGVVAITFINGADEESDDDLRERGLDAQQNTAQGGADADYRQWAQAAGADGVWVVQNVATLPYITVVYTGSVAQATVQTALDADAPIDAIPVAGSVDNNATYQYGVGMSITAHSLTGYADVDVEDNIKDVVKALFDQEGGTSETVYNSQLRSAIQGAPGVDYSNLTALSDPSGALLTTDDLTSGATTVHWLGAVVFTWIP